MQKHEPLDLMHGFIMKISGERLKNDEGVLDIARRPVTVRQSCVNWHGASRPGGGGGAITRTIAFIV